MKGRSLPRRGFGVDEPSVRFVDEVTIAASGGSGLVDSLVAGSRASGGLWAESIATLRHCEFLAEPLDAALAEWTLRAEDDEAVVAASCWFARAHGGHLLSAFGAAAVIVRARAQLRSDLSVHLSQARASVVALAGAPPVFVVVATAGGISPLGTLLSSPLGRLGLAAAAVLELGGLVWMRVLVGRVLR